jgi:hypothetical protein
MQGLEIGATSHGVGCTAARVTGITSNRTATHPLYWRNSLDPSSRRQPQPGSCCRGDLRIPRDSRRRNRTRRCPSAAAVTRPTVILAERERAAALRSAAPRPCAGRTRIAVSRFVGLQRRPRGKHVAVCYQRVGPNRSLARGILHGRSSRTCDRRRWIGSQRSLDGKAE